MSKVRHGKNRQRILPLLSFFNDITQIIRDETQIFFLDSMVVAIFAVAGQRAYDQSLYFLKDFMAAESSQQAVEIFDIDLNILKEENMSFPVEGRRLFSV
jgi:hypothetical protein